MTGLSIDWRTWDGDTRNIKRINFNNDFKKSKLKNSIVVDFVMSLAHIKTKI